MQEYQTVTRNFYDYCYADKMVIQVSFVMDRRNIVLSPQLLKQCSLLLYLKTQGYSFNL